MRRTRALTIILAAALAATLSLASTASARDPGKWLLTGASSIPNDYWQGLTSNPLKENLYFIGPSQGLWQTNPQLVQSAGVSKVIPTAVKQSAGYNHVGDPTWLDGEGGRVLLPMECYNPAADPPNTCGTGAFGVADPGTLAFRYYVQLDPAFIPNAMWAETTPNGKRIWTSSGDDLIAYDASQVSQANAAPTGPELDPVKRLTGAVPPTGVTGAVFRNHRLLLAGESNHVYQVWAIDRQTGDRELQLEMHICGESEGLDTITMLGGRLHWLIAPSDSGCDLTFGPTSALLHFRRSPGHERLDVEPYSVTVGANSESSEMRVEVKARVTRPGGKPVRGANARFVGAHARTDRHGKATVSTTIETPGRFGVFARKGGRYGMSNLLGFNVAGAAHSSGRQTPRG